MYRKRQCKFCNGFTLKMLVWKTIAIQNFRIGTAGGEFTNYYGPKTVKIPDFED